MGKPLYFNGLRLRFKELVNGDQDMFLKIKELFRDSHDISDEELEDIEDVEQLWRLLVSKDVISMDNVRELKDLALELEDERLKQLVEDYESKTKGIIWSKLEDAWARVLRFVELSFKVVVSQGFEQFVFSYARKRNNRRHLERNVLPRLIRVLDVSEGCLCFVLETSNVASLKQLWTNYKDGSLTEKFKKAIIEIEEVRELSDGTEIDVTITIDEEEYREACWVLVRSQNPQGEDIDQPRSQHRPRCHSLSCERDLPTLVKPYLTCQEWMILNEAKNKVIKETNRRKDAEKEVAKLRQEMKLLKVEDSATKVEAKKEAKAEEDTPYGQEEKMIDNKLQKIHELHKMSEEVVRKVRPISGDNDEEMLRMLRGGEFTSQKDSKQQDKELQEAVRVGDKDKEGNVYGNLGKVCQSQGRYDEAMVYYIKQTEIAILAEDKAGEERGYRNLGSACQSGGNYLKAADYHKKSLATAIEIGDMDGQMMAYFNLGGSYYSLDKYYDAIENFNKSKDVAVELGDTEGERNAHENLEISKKALDEGLKAIDNQKEKMSHKDVELNEMEKLGAAYQELNQYDEAMRCYRRCLDIAEWADDKEAKKKACNNLADLYQEQGDNEMAVIFQNIAIKLGD